MTEQTTDLSVLDEAGAAEHEQAAPRIFDHAGLWAHMTGPGRRQVCSHGSKEQATACAGGVDERKARRDDDQRREAERIAGRKAEAEARLPKLRTKLAEAEAEVKTATAALRTAFTEWSDVAGKYDALMRTESKRNRAKHAVRRAEYEARHGNDFAPTIVALHRWNTLSDALNEMARERLRKD